MHCGDRWLLSILVCTLATATEIEVRTPYGQIQGFQSGSASVFLGIRYAKAPIGDLRLEKPVPVDPWRSPHQATSFGTSCYPEFRRNNFQNFSLSEDCLFLNVFAPQNAPPEGLPAVVFFHGGSFMRGSSTELGVDGILRNFVSRDLVFVTVNYRLSVLGFVTTEDDVLPGNLGFWDQTEALRFVKKVISSFGGNPDDITVGGSSAGATSVSALTLSPHSNKLFQKAIQISGSAFAFWAIGSPVGEQSRLLFEALNCRGNSSTIKTCLKGKTMDEILDTTEVMGRRYEQMAGMRYLPRLDGDFFPSNLETLVSKAPKIPSLTGVTDTEAGVFVFTRSNRTFITVTPAQRLNYSRAQLEKVFDHFDATVPGLKTLLEGFYLNGSENTSTFYLTQLVQLVSDLAFTVPCYQEAAMKKDHGWPVHLFVEQFYDGEAPRDEIPVAGSFHTNEMSYLFDVKPSFLILPEPRATVGEAFKKNMLEGFISFVKTGSPRVDGKDWLLISKQDPFLYMNFNETSSMERGFFNESAAFWTEVVPRRVDRDLLGSLLPALDMSSRVESGGRGEKTTNGATCFLCVFTNVCIMLTLFWHLLQ